MAEILQILGATCGIVSLICYIFVVVKMFQEGDTVMGIICAVGFFVCGVGVLVAFVYGWMKSSVWELKPVMLAWTGFWIAGFILNVIAGTMGAGAS